MQNQVGNDRREIIVFSELELAGTRVECPRCHVPFNPHLGNLIAPKFECGSCKANLSYRNRPGGLTVKCPCCNMWRFPPNRLRTLVCGGCDVTIIYQRGDTTVKCSRCKHITNPPPDPVRPADQVYAPLVYPVVLPQQVNRRTTTETESTASSFITPQSETPTTTVAEYSVAESVSEIVKNAVLRVLSSKREKEEDKTDEAESKKIRRL